MKRNVCPEPDSLYNELSSNPSGEDREVSKGMAPDYGARGKIGIQERIMHGLSLKIVE